MSIMVPKNGPPPFWHVTNLNPKINPMLHESANIETSYLAAYSSNFQSKHCKPDHCKVARNSVLLKSVSSKAYLWVSRVYGYVGSMWSAGCFWWPTNKTFRFTCSYMDWRHPQEVNGENNRYSQQNWMQNLFKKRSNEYTAKKYYIRRRKPRHLHTAHTEGLKQLNHD